MSRFHAHQAALRNIEGRRLTHLRVADALAQHHIAIINSTQVVGNESAPIISDTELPPAYGAIETTHSLPEYRALSPSPPEYEEVDSHTMPVRPINTREPVTRGRRDTVAIRYTPRADFRYRDFLEDTMMSADGLPAVRSWGASRSPTMLARRQLRSRAAARGEAHMRSQCRVCKAFLGLLLVIAAVVSITLGFKMAGDSF